MSFFTYPGMHSLVLLFLSISNLALIFAFHKLCKVIEYLNMYVMAERGVMQMLIDSIEIKQRSVEKDQTCQ